MGRPLKPGYRPDIDGLRAIAVIPVLLYHPGLGCPGDFFGVDVFFIISSLLITSLIFRDLERGTFSLVEFRERRVRRIFPALTACVGVTLLAGWFLLLPEDLKNSAYILTLEGKPLYYNSNHISQAGVDFTWKPLLEPMFRILSSKQ